ncbi:hypothetical protein ACIA49_38655 [Kribbella sp. NPDC051587]|uniref:hypothetical protein n=1 Tax=Kribbella sp. NPDC051587 TaxID=3364119 RepID=UPI0037B5A924
MTDEPPTGDQSGPSGTRAATSRYRPAPTERFDANGVRRTVDDWTDSDRRAVAMTVRNLQGWGTLPGKVLRFDPATGARLEPEVRLVGPYDRNEHGLPEGWADLLIRMGWLGLAWLADGSAVWKPIAAATETTAAWLPEHLQAPWR